MFSTMLKTREITPIQSIISNSVDVLGLSVFLCASHIDLNSAIITNWRQDKNRWRYDLWETLNTSDNMSETEQGSQQVASYPLCC